MHVMVSYQYFLLVIFTNSIVLTSCVVTVNQKLAKTFGSEMLKLLSAQGFASDTITMEDPVAKSVADAYAEDLIKCVTNNNEEEFQEGIHPLEGGSLQLQMRFRYKFLRNEEVKLRIQKQTAELKKMLTAGHRHFGLACIQDDFGKPGIDFKMAYVILISMGSEIRTQLDAEEGNLSVPNSKANIPKRTISVNNNAKSTDRVGAVKLPIVDYLEQILDSRVSGVTIEEMPGTQRADIRRSVKELTSSSTQIKLALGFTMSLQGTNANMTSIATTGNFNGGQDDNAVPLPDIEFSKFSVESPEELASTKIREIFKEKKVERVIINSVGNIKKVQYAFEAVGIEKNEEVLVFFAVILNWKDKQN